MKRRVFTRIISLLLVFSIAVGTAVFSLGGILSEVSALTLQEQINQKQDKVDELQQRLDELEKEGDELMAKMQVLNEQEDELKEHIDLIEERITELQNNIDTQTENISELSGDIILRDEMMAERIRAIYISGTSSYISMLFESKDFASFLETLDMLNALVEADKKLIEEYKATKTGYEEIKTALEIDMSDLEKSMADLESQKKKLDSNKEKTEKLIVKYEKAEHAAQAEMESQFEEMRELIRLQSQGEFVGGNFIWPVAGFGTITAVFGQKGKYWKNGHTGIDIAGYNKAGERINGKPILACNSGTVIDINTTNTKTGYGNYVTISHGGGISTLYAHMMPKSATVKKGDTVAKGQIIGYVGTTGNSTGYHLHLEFIVNGTRVDPKLYVSY